MIQKIQYQIESLLRMIYTWFYKEEPGEKITTFISHISYLSLAVMVSGIVLSILKIILIRTLGPTEYGVFSLVYSLTYFFYIPMLLGFHLSATQYLARSEDNREVIIGTAIRSVLIFIGLTVLLTLVLEHPLSVLFNVSPDIILLALIITSAFSMMFLVKGLLQGLQRFRLYALLEVGTAFTTFLFIVLFFVFHHITHGYAIAAYSFSFSIWVFIILIIFRRHIGPFSFPILKSLFHYGFFSIIAAIAGFLLVTTENLILYRYYGPTTLGYYAAYYSAAHALITNKILFIILSVLFPMLAYLRSQTQGALQKLEKLQWLLLVGLTITNTGVIAIIMYLFGKQYSFHLSLGVLFSLAASTNFITQLYATFLSAEGIRGVRIYTYGILILASCSFILNLIFIRWYGIYAVVIISCIINAIILFYFRWNLKRLRYGSTT
jgi:O-antigen/teichoic acid export membrane protein